RGFVFPSPGPVPVPAGPAGGADRRATELDGDRTPPRRADRRGPPAECPTATAGHLRGPEPPRGSPLLQRDAELPAGRPGPHDQRLGYARCVSRNRGEPDGGPSDPR